MLASTVNRVPEHTASRVNQAIAAETLQSVEQIARQGAGAIERRLYELNHEWDIERTLESNAASVALAGVALGAFVDRRWLLLPAAVGGFLLQHALQGWCPPLTWFRRLGFRTQSEIDYERYALKALRGDFKVADDPVSALAAARR